MVLALNVSVYFCKLLPLHMNGNLPVGIGMHVFAMICHLIQTRIMRCARAHRRRERRQWRCKVCHMPSFVWGRSLSVFCFERYLVLLFQDIILLTAA
eukprot:UN4364